MRYFEYRLIVTVCLLIIGLNIITLKACYGYTASFQDIKQGSTNQLLRISLEPTNNRDSVNVYLFTSLPNPQIQEKSYEDGTYIIELEDTSIATTNNINIQKVSDVIANVKIVPFIDTGEPSSTGIIRVIINSKVSNIKFKTIVKAVKLSGSNNAVTSKVYYPPKKEIDQPQNLAFFTPLDEDTLSKIPKERLIAQTNTQDPSIIPEIPNNQDTKLKVNPPPDSIPPVVDNNSVQSLPSVGSSVAPVANNDTGNQEGQSPQPAPTVSGSGVETVWPKNISRIVGSVCGIFLALMLLFAIMIIKSIRKQKKVKQQSFSSPPSIPYETDPASTLEGLEPIKETDLHEPRVDTVLDNKDPFVDEVEEIEVIDSTEINGNKALYFVQFMNNLALIGIVDGEVTVLNNFKPGEIIETPEHPLKMIVSKEGVIVGKEIYLVKISNWQGVVSSENNTLTFHSNLAV